MRMRSSRTMWRGWRDTRTWKARRRSSGQSDEPFCHLGPIHHIPPRLHVIRPTVLILQVVRVLPHVEPENRRRFAIHERIVLIRRAGDREFAPVVVEPYPARAEAAGADSRARRVGARLL